MIFDSTLIEAVKIVASAAVGGVAGWITRRTIERKRRAELSEASLLSWLDSQYVLVDRLAKFAERIRVEPKTLEEFQSAISDASAIQDITKLMVNALNRFLLYESLDYKRALLDVLTEKYSILLRALEIITSHQGTHLRFRETLARLTALETSVIENEVFGREMKDEQLTSINTLRCEASEYLSTCGAQLSDSAATLATQCQALRDDATKVRRLVTSGRQL